MTFSDRASDTVERSTVVRGSIGARCRGCAIGLAAGLPNGKHCPFVTKERELGALIYPEGLEADRVWYIVNGYVALSRELGEQGCGVTWAVRRPGELLGTEALVSGAYSDTARALTPTTLCSATRNSVDQWLGPANSPARVVLQLCLRTRCNETPRGSSSDGSATRRVARWLLDDAPGTRAQPIPRHVIAALLGMLPETLSRALAQLAAAGIITLDRKSIRVSDFDALLVAAGEHEAVK